jgi:hypothetical protein
MRVTIVADDNAVYVGGQALAVDLTGLDPEIHAVQWYDTWGDIEYRYDAPNNFKKPNERITDISPFQVFVDRWNTTAAAAQAAPAVKPAAESAATGAPVNVIAAD